MNIDRWLDAVCSPTYTCASFARDVWLDWTGKDVGDVLGAVLTGYGRGRLRREHVRGFRQLPAPSRRCIVIMRRPPLPLHMGVYFDGNVLHLSEQGVHCQPVGIATRFYSSVRYVEV